MKRKIYTNDCCQHHKLTIIIIITIIAELFIVDNVR